MCGIGQFVYPLLGSSFWVQLLMSSLWIAGSTQLSSQLIFYWYVAVHPPKNEHTKISSWSLRYNILEFDLLPSSYSKHINTHWAWTITVVYLSFRGFFQILCLVSAFLDTNKNKWLEKWTKTHFKTYCLTVKTNVPTYIRVPLFIQQGRSWTKYTFTYLSFLASQLTNFCSYISLFN
jgi:hypothetical protein